VTKTDITGLASTAQLTRRAGQTKYFGSFAADARAFLGHRTFHQEDKERRREHDNGEQPEAVEIGQRRCLLVAQVLQRLPRQPPTSPEVCLVPKRCRRAWLDYRGTKRRRDRASELTDRREHYPPMSEQNANFLEVLIGQMAESVKIYGVFSKSPRILGHAELFQPASDQIGTSSAPRVANTHQRASNRLSASVVAWLLDRG
jgi:hypothetical protein